MRTSSPSLWSRLVAVGLPFFRHGPRRRALLGLAILVSLLLLINGLNVVNSFVGRDVFTSLERRQADQFYRFALAFVAVFAVSTVVEVFARYVEQRMGL